MLTIHNTDALTALKEIESESVQCVVTSPPYWGLRDYGTATWEGGNPNCEHTSIRKSPDSDARNKQGTNAGSSRDPIRPDCRLCGATRSDVQIGLERTPEEYVTNLVEIFREVRRVLKKDGVLFLNVGDSYFGSWGNYGGQNRGNGKQRKITSGSQVPNPAYDGLERFRPPTAGPPRRGRGYDNADKATQGYQANGLSSESLDGERKDFWWSRIPDSDGHLVLSQSLESCSQIRACMEALHDRLAISDSSDPPLTRQSFEAILDQVHSSLPAVERLHAFLASMPDGFALLLPENFRPLDMLSAFLSSLRSLVSCVRRCVHMSDVSTKTSDYNEDIASPFAELADHIQCTHGCCLLLVSWLDYKPRRPTREQLNLKPKDLCMIPARVALALQADGWWLRSDIIWAKPNPMPESVADRPTKSHEYIFLLSKNERYYYNAEAIQEPASINKPWGDSHGGWKQRALGHNNGGRLGVPAETGRNKRSVWTISTESFPEAHFATFPTEIPLICILAGSKAGDTILDPFAGSGTTGKVAIELGRKAILIEPNPEYVKMIERRCQTTIGLPL